MSVTKEKIEQYKKEVVDAIMAMPKDPHAFPSDYAERAAETVKGMSDEATEEAMMYHTPQDYAELLLM